MTPLSGLLMNPNMEILAYYNQLSRRDRSGMPPINADMKSFLKRSNIRRIDEEDNLIVSVT